MSTLGTQAAVRTSLPVNVASGTLLAANAFGRANGRIVFNESATATLYLAFGSTPASLTSYTVRVPPNGTYEFSYPPFSGVVRCIWDVADGAGNARITEY